MSQLIPIQPLAIEDDTRIAQSIASVPVTHLPIIECFHGIEGEGLNIGEPRILLRIGGCRVGCRGCDTPHSWALGSSTMYAMGEVEHMLTTLLDQTGVTTVAITGGEPMHYPEQLRHLTSFLHDRGVRSWLETSGLLLDADVMADFDYLSLDVKTPSSGAAAFTPEAVRAFTDFVHAEVSYGQIKFIVTDDADLDWIEANFKPWLLNGTPLYEDYNAINRQPVVITPACGKGGRLEDIAQRMQRTVERFSKYNVRIIAQQHAMLSMQ